MDKESLAREATSAPPGMNFNARSVPLPLSRSISSDIKVDVGAGYDQAQPAVEEHSQLPAGQRMLIKSRTNRPLRVKSVDDAEHTGGLASKSVDAGMHRLLDDSSTRLLGDSQFGYGTPGGNTNKPSGGGARRRRRANNILDGMIQSERFAPSMTNRYMVPQTWEDEEKSDAPSGLLEDLPVSARVIEYESGNILQERQVDDLSGFLRMRSSHESIVWIYIEGVPTGALKVFKELYRVHPLALEDVQNTPQRPKVDQYENMLLMIAHSPELLEQEEHGGFEFLLNQVSIFVLYERNMVVTFQEYENTSEGNWRQRVERRVQNDIEGIRSKDLSHLVYAVMDSIADRYFPLLEFYGDRMEELEGALIDEPQPDLIKGITRLKRDLLLVRRNVWPLRECVSRLMVLPDSMVQKATKMYLRDLQDHLVQLVDILETYRDVSMGLLDLYLSATNNKMQEVMKTLTIISTIFIPLTFITGVYGMNFEFMPELKWHFSYLVFWIFVVAIITLQVYYFHRVGWT